MSAPVTMTARTGTKRLGEALLSPGESVRIGSAADCGFRIDDVTVSRRHLVAELEGDGVRVRDTGSTNGTRLKGVRTSDAVVPVPGVVLVGDVELGFERAEQKQRLVLGELESVSPPMVEAMRALSRAPGAVLLIGERGCGKEYAARAIGPPPFHVVDLHAPPKELPKDGTLFFDHLDDPKPHVKWVLLHSLEKPLNARILGAALAPTDLLDAVAAIPVRLPSLRERPDDIPLLARQLLREHGRKTAGFMPSFQSLQARRWPGNVTELKAAIADAVAFRVDDELSRAFAAHLLARFDGNVRKAASEAGIDPHKFPDAP
ncbi:MAG: FHA domain-containing protein [Myxococcaceae bacterium]|nr:FHA domain-containing protein [Myxococcaceae bacterium]